MKDGNIKQFTYDDEQTSTLLKETLTAKMREAGLEEDETLDIKFDTSCNRNIA